MVHQLNLNNSIFNTFIAEIRDKSIQQDPLRFRRNLERIGEIFAYEISKKLNYSTQDVITPLGTAKENLILEQPVLATILRAGLPLHIGLLNYFDRAENAFISAYRKATSDKEFEIEIEYLSSPRIDNKVLILNDPMLASGASMVMGYQAMLEKGTPKEVHVVSIIASRQGVEYAKKHLPSNVTFWIGAIDEELNSKSYIIPGLGDAGDLAYGTKE